MSAAIVELVILDLKEGVNVMEEGPSKTTLDGTVAETNRRPGCHANYLGIPEEKPGVLYIIAGEDKRIPPSPAATVFHLKYANSCPRETEWESMQAHSDWQNHPDYPDFMARVFSICDSSTARVLHFHLIPQGSITARASPFNAPITEVSWVYYPESVDVEAHRAEYERYRAKAPGVAPVQGMQGGWVIEETELPGTGGEKGKLFLEYTGRASTADHLSAAEELTKEGGVGCALLEGSRSRTTVHVAFQWTSSSQWQVS